MANNSRLQKNQARVILVALHRPCCPSRLDDWTPPQSSRCSPEQAGAYSAYLVKSSGAEPPLLYSKRLTHHPSATASCELTLKKVDVLFCLWELTLKLRYKRRDRSPRNWINTARAFSIFFFTYALLFYVTKSDYDKYIASLASSEASVRPTQK